MKRLLIANRGEIAVRIIRGARALGIETVAIYSDADADALHVRLADHAVHVGPTPASESYLDIGRVVAAATTSGADAVHPGYGFLSENPAFAEAVANAGLTFVGPSADAMRALGDKNRAKEVADAAKVPTVPSWQVDAVPADAFPVLVKASAGGGGRGMRVVREVSSLDAALDSARREAQAGFGDDTLLVEKLVEGARHVEVQLLADEHGTCLYVGDRDCSLQRRHQKVVEEAPASTLSEAQHVELGEAAVRIARAAGYTNAGTAEFLVDTAGNWYFLELNARLQVEHPATELAYGVDLVQWQLRIARGEQLTLAQGDIRAQAHAIEARLYAEDPVTFLPTGGRILALELPAGDLARVDHGIEAGQLVGIAYDPLLAKLIAVAGTRDEARRKLLAALRATTVLGLTTNQALLQHALELPEFVRDEHDITTLESERLDEQVLEAPDELVTQARHLLAAGASSSAAQPVNGVDPFQSLGAWRGAGTRPVRVHPLDADAGPLHVAVHGEELWLGRDGLAWVVARSHVVRSGSAASDGADADSATLTAPMPGAVIQVAEVGARVAAGEAIVVLEAMKMENALAAPFDGIVESIDCAVGEQVNKGSVLAHVTRSVERESAPA